MSGRTRGGRWVLRMLWLPGIVMMLGALSGCAGLAMGGEGSAPETVSPPASDDPVGGAPPDEDGAPVAARWQPHPGTSWQWQLQGTLDLTVDAEVFDIDLFDTSAATIARLQEQGRRVICYFSAGSYEPWRPDASRFPSEVLGAKMSGWDEWWLDVRRIDLLAPVMRTRLDLARDKGCDAVEPDNIDAYANTTGFPLTAADQIAYNRFLAVEAHQRGLAIGLKNAVELVPILVADFDFAVNEECHRWRECHRLLPFVEAGKAVFGAEYVEYGATVRSVCPLSNELGLDVIIKRLDLGAYRVPCD